MTREEARNLLNNNKPKGNNAYSIMLNEALDMAIKALKQESVLDKIRAEIDNALSDGMIHKQTVLGIIDMYKAESEE